MYNAIWNILGFIFLHQCCGFSVFKFKLSGYTSIKLIKIYELFNGKDISSTAKER